MKEKDALRKLLESQVQQHLEANPDAVTLYAPERKPDRMPWKKRPSLIDQSFKADLEKAEKELQKKHI